jgi:hypothetical protein
MKELETLEEEEAKLLWPDYRWKQSEN